MQTQTILTIIIVIQGLVIWGKDATIEELQKMVDYWHEKYSDQEIDEDEQ